MCGIVGYVGKKINLQTAIKTLKKLEYCGYDSAGIAFIQDKGISAIKELNSINNLIKKAEGLQGKICLCHTRWATHGEVNITNAHPQISYNNNFAVVHNGIIENYKELKAQIGEENFISQTDTEVVANLLEKQEGTTLNRVISVCEQLKGRFAIAIIDERGKSIYLAKRNNPLYVAKTAGGYIVASDISCIDATEYYSLEDNMVAQVDRFKATFYLNGQLIKLNPLKKNYTAEQIALNGYNHFMEKEIAETASVIKNISTRYESMFDKLFEPDMFKNFSRICFIGCGTSYHASLLGASWLKNKTGINAEACVASEYRYNNPIIDKKTLLILVSQSGETADTLAVAEMAKSKGATIYAITNAEHSTIVNFAQKVFPTCAGPEIAVASTKAYSAMLAVMYLLANYQSPFTELAKNLVKAAELISNEMDVNIVDVVKASKRIFFIGRVDDGVTSQEAALKLKETAYLDTYGYYAGELKHGPIALIEPGIVVCAIVTSESLKSKTLNAVEEVKSRGATTIIVTDDLSIEGDYTIRIPQIDVPELKSLLAVIPFQTLAYKVTCKLNQNPDQPRNLAKSVTVE